MLCPSLFSLLLLSFISFIIVIIGVGTSERELLVLLRRQTKGGTTFEIVQARKRYDRPRYNKLPKKKKRSGPVTFGFKPKPPNAHNLSCRYKTSGVVRVGDSSTDAHNLTTVANVLLSSNSSNSFLRIPPIRSSYSSLLFFVPPSLFG